MFCDGECLLDRDRVDGGWVGRPGRWFAARHVWLLTTPQILGRGELDLVVFRFVKPEDAEAFRDRFARNCPRRLIGTTEPKTMNAPYRDQSMKVTVHFAPCEDGGLMVWSERWRGLTQSIS
jgi:hypothetical protein